MRRALASALSRPARGTAAAAATRTRAAPTLAPLHRASSSFIDPAKGLTPEQLEYLTVAQQFAAEKLAPHAAKWDEEHIFPEEALREAAGLGFGGLYVSPDHGGSGLSRADSMPIIEALATADVR